MNNNILRGGRTLAQTPKSFATIASTLCPDTHAELPRYFCDQLVINMLLCGGLRLCFGDWGLLFSWAMH
eukprot:scaffold147457_cov17-Prasinocladus_malaysianus.AAC.1